MPRRFPALLLAVGSALALVLPPSTPTHAQACSPRQPVGVSVQADGQVTLTPGAGTITRVVMTTESATLVQPSGYQAPRALPYDTGAISVATYPLWIRPSASNAAATVHLTVYDACGAWQTFAGTGGATAFATAGPSATPVPNATATATAITPTIGPTSTKLPTLTPVPTATVPLLGIDTLTIEPEDFLYVSWAGVSNPDAGDKLQLFYANTATPANGIFYASSCKEGLIGASVKPQGTCPIRISTGTPPGGYQFKYLRAGQSVPLATSATLSVQTVAASNGDAQLFHLRSELEDPGVCGCTPGGTKIGYMGVEGDVTTLRSPEWLGPNAADASMIGAANRFNHGFEQGYPIGGGAWTGDGTLFFPSGWSEVGLLRRCVDYTLEIDCRQWPFHSVGTLYNRGQVFVLDGTQERSWMPVLLNSEQHFRTFNVGGGLWTGEWCGRSGTGSPCCPIWPEGPFCGALSRADWAFAPLTLVDGFRHVFAGQEGQRALEGIGWSRQRNLVFCCNAWPTWDTWQCEPSPPRWGRRSFHDVLVTSTLACDGPHTFLEQSVTNTP